MLRSLQVLLILLAPLAVFAAMVAADRVFGAPARGGAYVLRIELPPASGQVGLPEIAGPLDASRPLVVIDAGHGGHDPGAGTGRIKEKEITLALALDLRDRLLADGGVRVALTRGDDRYLLLPERSGIARRLKADLFISIHADSTEDPNTKASGGTLYTLSTKGSDEIAERLAARENRADSVNGVALADTSDAVSAILVDLSQRETQAQSDLAAALILREGAGRLTFREGTVQSAAFVVLKSPDTPSILFEAGYITSPADFERLTSAAWRADFAAVTARAIRVFFARQAGVQNPG